TDSNSNVDKPLVASNRASPWLSHNSGAAVLRDISNLLLECFAILQPDYFKSLSPKPAFIGILLQRGPNVTAVTYFARQRYRPTPHRTFPRLGHSTQLTTRRLGRSSPPGVLASFRHIPVDEYSLSGIWPASQ